MTKLVMLKLRKMVTSWLPDGSKAVDMLKARGWEIFASQEAPEDRGNITNHPETMHVSGPSLMPSDASYKAFLDEKLVYLNELLDQEAIELLLDAGFDTYEAFAAATDRELIEKTQLSRVVVRKIRRALINEPADLQEDEE